MAGPPALEVLMSFRKSPALAALTSLLTLLLAGRALAIGDDEFLDATEAFKYSVTADESTVTVEWHATPGYYLYKKRMGLSAATPGVTVGEPVYPPGEIHKDEYFGEQTVFRNDFKVTAPLTGAKAGDTIALKLKWQGCADAGLCYPPSVWDATVKVAAASKAAASKVDEVFGKGKAGAVVEDEDDFLPVDSAFALTADAKPGQVLLNWRIADGYYLYKDRIKLAPADSAAPGSLALPKGEPHHDDYFGDQEIYRESLDATFQPPAGAKSVSFKITYQGCADAGLCYPPETKLLTVSLDGAPTAVAAGPAATSGGSSTASLAGGASDSAAPCTYVSEQDSLADLITNGNLGWVMLVFFSIGLGLAFTPCVFPMVPILSGIIAGGGEHVSTRRSFLLSLSYVLGMAFTYTLAGIIAALVGGGLNLQAMFNTPWVLIVFALMFVALAASMFGFYTIQMPSFIQTRLTDSTNKQQAGTYIGVAVMGLLSALIVSACAAPALVAALATIAQTGDVVRGGSSLFALSIGMGMPLLLVGTSLGTLLPRAGAWMDMVKNLFGVAFIGVATWMISRIAPAWVAMLGWALTALLAAWFLWRGISKPSTGRTVARALGVVAAACGAVLLVGTALGGTDPLSPIPQLAARQTKLSFKRFKTLDELQSEIAGASQSGKAVMVDFYADWCISCLEMEHKTFTQPAVQKALADVVLLQAAVTANDDEDRELYVHFGIPGPPTIAFYGPDGRERRNFRVVGFMKAAEFAAVVRQAVAPATCTTP
jgi:thiol:disulfide interchange protein DsbD